MNYKIIISSLLIGACSLAANAGHKNNGAYNNRYNDVSSGHLYDYGRVSSVSPIYETIEHRIPRQCNHRHTTSHRQRSATPAILGGIIGAALGNELGHHKRNKQVGAVVGGILGASIGSDINTQPTHPSHRKCKQYDIEYEERVVGYDVTYRYHGNNYSTTTREHPGKKIQLKLYIEPVVSR